MKFNFDDLVASKVLTAAGAAWLKIALDPFHDHRVSGIEGFPDVNATESIVRLSKSSTVVSAPGAGTWDLMVHFTPVDGDQEVFPVVSMTDQQVTVQQATGATQLYGWWTLVAVPSGTPFAPRATVIANSGTNQFVSHTLFADKSPLRVIAAGLEVVNKTAEIAKGGSVTVAQRPCLIGNSPRIVHNEAGTIIRETTLHEYAGMPKDLTMVDTWANSVKMEARDGVYYVNRFTSLDNPPSSRNFRPAIMTSLYGNQCSEVSVNGSEYRNFDHVPPLNGCSMCFTGLDPACVLEFNSRVWYEKFPTDVAAATDREAVSPSARFDPKALELYTQIAKKIPVVCRQTENPAGEWFRQVLSILGSVLKTGAPALSMVVPEAAPFAPLVAAAGSALEQTMQRTAPPRKKPKKKPGVVRYPVPRPSKRK